MQCSFQHCSSPASTQTSSHPPKLKAVVRWTAGQSGTVREGISFHPGGICCSQMLLHSPSSSHDS